MLVAFTPLSALLCFEAFAEILLLSNSLRRWLSRLSIFGK